MLKILLALRNHAHQVEVQVPNGESRPVLGTSHPEEENRRANVVRQWGGAESPRQQRPATIDVPLPQRSQTILSYRLNPALRQYVNGGLGPLADSRLHNRTTSTETLETETPPSSPPSLKTDE